MKGEMLNEHLSLLVDDKLGVAEAKQIYRETETHREAAETYSRYLLVSQVLRTGGAVIHDKNFVDRVHAAIEHEPTVLAPRRERTVRDGLVTVALAATLAGVAVLVGNTIMRQSEVPFGRTAESIARNDAPAVDAYMVSHNGTSYLAANGGLMPYLRVMSHGSSGR
jgi:sigma-E factor negative regulatory protein RseA